jgi:hypothetical protein
MASVGFRLIVHGFVSTNVPTIEEIFPTNLAGVWSVTCVALLMSLRLGQFDRLSWVLLALP